jgi:hypothetical protein
MQSLEDRIAVGSHDWQHDRVSTTSWVTVVIKEAK